MKICSKCLTPKEIKEFHKQPKNRDGLYSQCKLCDKVRQQAYKLANPGKVRSRWLQKTYGITIEQFDQMVLGQGGCCAICKKPPSGDRPVQKVLNVDHCHRTGRVRGLLCNRCNAGVGYLGDDPLQLIAAAEYLKKGVNTMTTETTKRISTKRLRAAINLVNNARKLGIGIVKYPEYPGTGRVLTPDEAKAWYAAIDAYQKNQVAISAQRATALYSLRSHLRNRLHITHQYIQKPIPGSAGYVQEVCETRTMEDQAALVAPLMEEFQMTPEELALDEELRAKRIALLGAAWEGQQDPLPNVC